MELDLSIGHWIAGVLARSFGRVVDRMRIGTISCLIRRSRAFGDARDYVTLVHTFHHWQFFLCAYRVVGRQQGVGSDGSAVPASGSDSRSNIRSSIYRLVVGSQAYRRDRSVSWTVGVAQSLSGWVVVRY